MEPIVSPYQATKSKRVITDADLAKVKELLGVQCLLIVADTEKHECTPDTCTGHNYSIRQSGFSPEQLFGLVVGLAGKFDAGDDIPGMV